MNTRLQVEHPVTELITGLDLVREMVRVAHGQALGFGQEDIVRRGHAIECRVYAEDPSSGFLPSPGRIEKLRLPGGPGVRDDGGAYAGCEISSYYDPLISKLSVWAPDRPRAVAKMSRALREYVVTGIRTNLAFHQRLMAHPAFIAGDYDTGFIDRYRDELVGYPEIAPDDAEAWAVATALAASRLEGNVRAPAEQGGARGPSPWVMAERGRWS
jgi:acetyl-CoA carboxylase biotin carboxylase subunit